MSLQFDIIRDYYSTGVNLYNYKNKTVEFTPGLTVLTGCNGAGKTTLLKHIKLHCHKNDIPFKLIDNRTDGGSSAMQKALESSDIFLLATKVQSSEGENISLNMGTWAKEIGSFMTTHNKYSDTNIRVLAFDAIDSGLSIDNIIEIKEEFFKFVLAEEKDKEVYIIVSANSYEMARGENCFDVTTGKYTMFSDYEAYRKYIIDTRNKKCKRYKQDPFNYK